MNLDNNIIIKPKIIIKNNKKKIINYKKYSEK